MEMYAMWDALCFATITYGDTQKRSQSQNAAPLKNPNKGFISSQNMPI